MRGEGKIQIGFDAGLEPGQSNPVKAFDTKQENDKGTSMERKQLL
jgi:hypothetical protein